MGIEMFKLSPSITISRNAEALWQNYHWPPSLSHFFESEWWSPFLSSLPSSHGTFCQLWIVEDCILAPAVCSEVSSECWGLACQGLTLLPWETKGRVRCSLFAAWHPRGLPCLPCPHLHTHPQWVSRGGHSAVAAGEVRNTLPPQAEIP